MKVAQLAGFLRYGIVGLLTLVVYLLMGELLSRVQAGFEWQASLPFLTAVVFNYTLQRNWVFNDSRPITSSLSRYVVMVLIGYAINYAVLLILIPLTSLLLAQLVAIVIVITSNALFAFMWVYCVTCQSRPRAPQRP